jgi:hypothetical protein
MTQANLVGDFGQASPAAARRRVIGSRLVKGKKISWPVFLFLIGLVVPWVIYVGPFRMSVYRFVLLAMVLPCVGMWVTGKAGRVRTADIALILYWVWCTLSFIETSGAETTVSAWGMGFVETLGPYLLARCYIRNAEDLYNAVWLMFWIVAFLLPFAIIECVTGINILRELFGAIFPLKPNESLARSGLTRVQSVFDQAILFGVFTGSIVGLVYSVLGYRKNFFERALRTGIVIATSFCSLSAGPLGAVIAQVFLLLWNHLLATVKIRWKILIGLLVFLDVTIRLFTNRTLILMATSFVVFDPASYWVRMEIWQYGLAAALSHPFFGVGMLDWERPEWLLGSIDDFWLVNAVNHGLPAVFLLLLNFFSIVFALGFKKGLDDKLTEYRTGLLLTMTAFFLAGWTVAFWDHVYVLYLFVMGSGVWILDVKNQRKNISVAGEGYSRTAVVQAGSRLRGRGPRRHVSGPTTPGPAIPTA